MAAAQVMSSPELLSLIFESLGEQHDDYDELEDQESRSNRSTLAAAARVNSIWFETATRTLWRFERLGPRLEHFNKIRTERRQFYASRLTSIKIEHRSGQKPSIKALSFPRRRAIHVGQVGSMSGPSSDLIKRYLCPSIVSISLCKWFANFNLDILNTIKSECPRLRSLELNVINIFEDTDITPEDFNDFFRSKSLESLKITIGPPLVDKDLISILGKMETLKKLSMTLLLWQQTIPDFGSDEVPFKNLQQVDLKLDRNAVRSATKAIWHASKVKLHIMMTGTFRKTTMFKNLKYMKNCRDLTLIFEGNNTYLDEEDLCNLNTLKRLEYLVLMPFREDTGEKLEDRVVFHDASDFEAVFAGLQRLHSLKWWLSGMNLSVQTLNRLSRNHRFRNIFFRGSWDLLGLTEVEGCLFPNLRNLTLSKAVIPGHKGRVPYKQIAENLLRHAPKLEKLKFTQEKNTRVLDSWKKLKREKAARLKS